MATVVLLGSIGTVQFGLNTEAQQLISRYDHCCCPWHPGTRALPRICWDHPCAAIQRRASSGCSKPHNFVGQTREFSFESSGGTRTYRIHLPSSYKVGSPMPLLIAYHGSGNNPTAFERETRFSDERINPNMITVYPAGVNVCIIESLFWMKD